MRFKDKNAIVVGGGRNAGRAICRKLAQEGANVAIVVKGNMENAEGTAKLVREAGGKAVPIAADATDREDVFRAVKEATDALGPIDVLSYCIGYRPESPFLDLPPETWRQVFATNVDGAFYFAQAVLPQMVERKRGSIVFTTGLSAHQGRGINKTHVGASKGALRALVHGLAAEFGPHGIRINAMAPTNISVLRDRNLYPDNRFPSDTEDDSWMNRIPLRRRGTPEEVANAVVFLASDEAGFITGESLQVNGGMYMS
ncbi:MAG: SDR family NAD(P)-dependent oxidoreductase [Rhodospirillales bacterium]